MSTDTGGPAFPVEMNNPSDKEIVGFAGDMLPPNSRTEYPGMTLRDYFAAKALPAVMAMPEDKWHWSVEDVYDEDTTTTDQYAYVAYIVADAMLKAKRHFDSND